MSPADHELHAAAARIETLVREVESFSDARCRAVTTELLQALLSLYGHGWERMLEIVNGGAPALFVPITRDALLSHLLCLHGLHPTPLDQRVAEALDEVRPALRAHGGNVELLGIEGSVARVRLHGSCHGCPSSSLTLKTTVEEALKKAAPELEAVRVDGMDTPDLITVSRP